MSFTFAGILSKEFTCIPEILSKYFGRFYSNALCNGCTWLFIIWYILHSGLDYALNELFRKMKYKEYSRTRLKHSLWYLGFYSTAFAYTGATLFQNRVDVLGFRKIHSQGHSDVTDLVIGFLVLFTFFLHSAFWEVMEYNLKTTFLSYILLCSVLLVSFFLRILEVAFTLTAFISITQVSIESAKLLYVVTKQESSYLRVVVLVFFGLSLCSFVLSYLIGVPLIFLIPFGRKIISFHLPIGYILFTMLLSGWYVSEINNSPLFKLIAHWLFHSDKTSDCCGELIECSMFPPRNDMEHNLLQLRREIKEREEKMLALRKQSRKGVLAQTIKCMVNLKRKLQAKRASSEKASEKDSEESSDSYEMSRNDESKYEQSEDDEVDETKGLLEDPIQEYNTVEDTEMKEFQHGETYELEDQEGIEKKSCNAEENLQQEFLINRENELQSDTSHTNRDSETVDYCKGATSSIEEDVQELLLVHEDDE